MNSMLRHSAVHALIPRLARRKSPAALSVMRSGLCSASPDQQEADLLVSKADGLLSMQLNRPSKLNSIKQSMYLDLSSALDSASTDPDVRIALSVLSFLPLCPLP